MNLIALLFFQLTNIDEGYLSLMNDDNETRDDLKLPEGDLGKEIQVKFDNDEQLMLTVLKAMGEEAVVGTKPLTK